MNQKHYDLVVIGAGILGTFHCYHALLKRKSVLLLEKNQFPIDATVRNFGQVVPSGMPASWFPFGRRALEVYHDIQREFDISLRNNGSVYIASDPDEQQLLHELKDEMNRRAYSAELLTPADCRKKWPALNSQYCREGLFFPREVSVEPNLMVHALHDYLKGKFESFTYRPSTTVVGCSPSGHHAIVTTHDGQLFSAEKVVICNGGEFKLLFAEQFRRSGIQVSKLQMLRTKPMPGVELDGNILTGLTIRRYESFQECPSFAAIKTPERLVPLEKLGIHILFKKAIDHSIIIGDSHEYADVNTYDQLGFTLNQDINERMLDEAARVVDFDVRAIASSWAGFYPQHPDGIFELDLEDCIHIRTAIGGKGMTTGAGYSEASIHTIFALS